MKRYKQSSRGGTMTVKPLIYDYSLHKLTQLMGTWKEPSYRAVQIWQGLYQQYWNSIDDFTNLPTKLREVINTNFAFSHLEPEREIKSQDKFTEKILFRLPEHQMIETVLMHYPRTKYKNKERHSLCISTQAGCGMGCVFCATGQMGLHTNLSSGEIVEQVIYFARKLDDKDMRVSNIVIMGMGEPFQNYEQTLDAINRLNHPEGFKFGARRITISTVGLVPMIKRFAAERRQVNLAVSLHAADNDLRSSILPINKKYPLEQLIPACYDYVRETNRRITFEWALINQLNDSIEDAKKLVELLDGLLCHVNIIPLNPTNGYAGVPTSHTRALAFQAELQRNNIPCTIRKRRGIEIQAGCGQLAADMNSK